MYKIIKLQTHRDSRGELVAIENSRDIPFDVKRVFYIFNVKHNAKRSQHANMTAQEIILCLNGCCEIFLDDGKGKKVSFRLSRKDESIYVEPEVWVELSNFSNDCVLLAMSDTYYDRKDQIHDYQEFLRLQNDKIFGLV